MGTTKKTTAKKTVSRKKETSKTSALKTTAPKTVVRKTTAKAQESQPTRETPSKTKLESPVSTTKTNAKTTVRKTAASKATVKKTTEKKTVAKKTAAGSSAKTVAKKTSVKKTAQTTAKKTAVKKTATLKETPRKTTVRKTAAKTASSATKPAKSAVKKTTRKTKTSDSTGATLTVEKPPMAADNPQVEIESKKFDVSHEQEIAYPTPPSGYGLPDFYDETYVRLLVRDPEWVFVYWEIDAKTRERFWIPRGAHSGRLILRWYDITDVPDFDGRNAQRLIETTINDQASSWYQHLPDPGHFWCAELGVLSAEGEFLCICRSNVVQTPRVTMASPREYERWMRVGWLLEEREVFEAPAGQAPPEAQGTRAERARMGARRKAWEPGGPGGPESGAEEMATRLAERPFGGPTSESLISSFGFISSSQLMRPELAEQLETLKKIRKK